MSSPSEDSCNYYRLYVMCKIRCKKSCSKWAKIYGKKQLHAKQKRSKPTHYKKRVRSKARNFTRNAKIAILSAELPRRLLCYAYTVHIYIYTLYINVSFSRFGFFFSSGRGSFHVLSAPWRTGSPRELHTELWDPAKVRGTCSWGLKMARPLGEGFRARRAIQAHAK